MKNHQPAHDDVDDADDADDTDDVDDDVVADDVEPEQDQQLEFSEGPVVTYVLTQYEHHVARRIWEGEDPGLLKVITHGLKLKKFSKVPMLDPVLHWIRESGLLPLSSAYLIMADVGLISAFVERWHRDISSFHMPFGEMTITLDDVATLLHISPCGKFFDAHVNMNTDNAVRATYDCLIQTNQFECAARTYLLHLVGCTIFADKTHARVEAKYVSLFIELDSCRDYSWTIAALAFLYDNLGNGVVDDTRQLGGYMTLLQCWIYEHFPNICKRGDRGAVPAHLPRACRWTAKHAVEDGLMTYHRRLDALLLDDIFMFSGYLRFGGASVPYLPERCLRQFGRIQCIPRDVPRVPNSIDWE
uniref:Protein MAIN-LIKE 1-like n=1 Tax=Cicer arietinum TaxID=3827 RepID=A0A1S2YTT8_CICAR|nr:protein MAIN-LIKE 1-like [Cicer arietinum]